MKKNLFMLLLLHATSTLLAQQMPADFPKHTGDDAAYAKAKAEWIEKNPAAYVKMGGVVARAEDKAERNNLASNRATDYFDVPTDAKVWVLRDARIEDVSKKRSPEQVNALNQDLQQEYALLKLKIAFTADKFYFVDEKQKTQAALPFSKKGSDLILYKTNEIANCTDCAKIHYTILKETKDSLIVSEQDQDEGSELLYILTFEGQK
jgi:hypothetical protein